MLTNPFLILESFQEIRLHAKAPPMPKRRRGFWIFRFAGGADDSFGHHEGRRSRVEVQGRSFRRPAGVPGSGTGQSVMMTSPES